MYAYAVPPPGYAPNYDYIRTPPVSPAPVGHQYYSPRFSSHTATPSPRASPKTHSRRASQADMPPMFTAYSGNPRMPGYYSGYSSPRYYPSHHSTPLPRRDDYVSGAYDHPLHHHHHRSKSRRHYAPAGMPPARHRPKGDSKHRSSHSRYHHTVVVEDDYPYYDDEIAPPPPPYQERYYPTTHDDWFAGADYYDYYDQVPVYAEAETPSGRSRTRRASHSTAKPSPQKPRPSPAKPTRKATDEDAARAGIPAGYSIKNWDPTEEPIMLLGSVFDANSLGKWIYDWTVFHYGPATPMSEVSGELWLLLIQLAGKVKRAEECMPKIRRKENREMVEDFLESGDRLWMRFAKLLKVCEDYMWKAAKKESGREKPVSMGKNAGCEFVDTIFGRDRELEMTEKLMTGMRLWSMRFDANCEEILRHPSS